MDWPLAFWIASRSLGFMLGIRGAATHLHRNRDFLGKPGKHLGTDGVLAPLSMHDVLEF